MRKPVLITILLVLVPLLSVSPAAAATASPPAATEIAWEPCAEDSAVECGTLTVPVDWNKPRGETFELALARRKATDPAARIGSLVVNPGGPGSSGVNSVLQKKFGFTSKITSRFDIVGFDPRGVGRSHPILCSVALAEREPDLVIRDQAGFDRRLAYNEQVRQDCRARTGPLFDHVDGISVVRDLDALRAALGDEKLTFYGLSYGTLFGQQYAEHFPHRVRAIALDSNMDHSLDTTAFVNTWAWTAQDSFNEFVAWCAKNTECALHGKDVRTFWSDLLARADRGELRFPGLPDTPLTRTILIEEVFRSFYGPYWAELADALVAIDQGTATAPMMFTTPSKTRQETYNNPIQGFCQDFHLPVRDYREYARHLRTAAAIAPDMRYGAGALILMTPCLGQPTPIPNPQRPVHADGAATLLIGNARHDPSTGLPWAASLARQIGREARLLTYDGWGHGVYGRSECVTDAFDHYLVSLTLPAKGARCAAVPPDQAGTRQARPQPIEQFPVRPDRLGTFAD
ncbi:alpha/beta hydrolase [Nonomuraea glycinis]|uniref:Peptidase n=1 Tax=Nonomuraea glycinis TaxID=2047744 RepID=A0A918A556_9ACTN|nr:alpha/beta hydrolase [Nonomuraea glycinis]MCA2180432.1 alpha/beta hydrolase [Nonomuraea glycinis]GGP04176.1 peptidase [Nonomuraea glycinis]